MPLFPVLIFVAGNYVQWVRPSVEDIQTVVPEQIVPCGVAGIWAYEGDKPTYCVTNHGDITTAFRDKFIN